MTASTTNPTPSPAPISTHASPADAMTRRGFGPRVRRLHARIGRAHHQAEGMVVSRSLLAGTATPLQLAALIRALMPAYDQLEALAPLAATSLGDSAIPWGDLARRPALEEDRASLAALPATPSSPALDQWLARLQQLAATAPHRLLAHAYVRYGGDLSGGQKLAPAAAAILAAHGMAPLQFWQFAKPVEELRQGLHDGLEALPLTPRQEEELLEEAEEAFRLTQQLLAELETLAMLHKYDRSVPRYTSYPTATAFTPAVGGADLAAALANDDDSPVSLYVHVPFCRHACWYCGCNRVTTQAGSKAVTPYLAAIAQELALVQAASGRKRRLAQLHWGGGTPNTLSDTECERLFALIAEHFELEEGLEASIEVNPEFVSARQLATLRRLGFSRISFGIQDADPDVQRAVNRVIATDQLRRVMGWMRQAGFASINVDLICGLPLQTPERFATTLDLVRDLRPDRVALFSFAYLPEQLPMQRHIAEGDLPDRAERLAMLAEAGRRLAAAGYEAIGMDHYALRDDSLAVAARQGRLHRNFQGYTTGGEWNLMGIGPSAISQFEHLSCQNERNLWAWQAAVAAGRLPVERGVRVEDPLVLHRRMIIRELMCRFEVTLPSEGLEEEWAELEGLAADGLVRLHPTPLGRRVEVTALGRLLIRTVAAVFDPEQRHRASGSRLI